MYKTLENTKPQIHYNSRRRAWPKWCGRRSIQQWLSLLLLAERRHLRTPRGWRSKGPTRLPTRKLDLFVPYCPSLPCPNLPYVVEIAKFHCTHARAPQLERGARACETGWGRERCGRGKLATRHDTATRGKKPLSAAERFCVKVASPPRDTRRCCGCRPDLTSLFW